MKLPGRRRGGAGGDSEAGGTEEQERDPDGIGEDSERARRERVAKERRERAARARADLAAKAKGEDAEGGDAGMRSRARRRRSGSRRKPQAATAGSRRERAREIGRELRSTLKQGAGETRGRTEKAAPLVAQRGLALLALAFGIFFDLLAVVLNLAIAISRILAGPVRSTLLGARRVLDAASRAITPARALALVVAGGIVLLALSQFADYRIVSIGNDSYADGIQTVAPAPEVDRKEAGSAHAYALIPVAAVCLALLALALGGRWRLCRLIALGGVAAIVIGLVIDRPAGLDPGDRELSYQGVDATLIGGFYAQLFAGLLLAVSALLLGRELRPSGAATPAPASGGSRVRRRLQRDPRAEGARA